MKKALNRGLRVALTIVILTLSLTISVLLYMEALRPNLEEQKVPVYKYKNKTDIDYNVFFKPNILYQGNSKGSDSIYITSFVDYIQPSFLYEFSGERVADISGDYEITAVLEGFIIENDEYKTIWEKKYELIPKESFMVRDKKILVAKDIRIRLEDYNNFVTRLIEESKVGSQVKMTVYMNVKLNAKTDKGLIEEKLSPAIVIPLNINYFEIAKIKTGEESKAVEEVKTVQVPPNKFLIIIYSTILLLSLLALGYLPLFTKPSPQMDPFIRNLNRILKNYGSRLVAVDQDIATTDNTCHKVKSFEDLIKIADEMGRPILYKYCNYTSDISGFYIIDPVGIYEYDPKDVLREASGKMSSRTGRRTGLNVENCKTVKAVSKNDAETQTKDI